VYELTREDPDDRWEVEALYDLCFAPGREALSSYRLRDGVCPVRDLCLVARDDLGILGGAIRFWPVRVGRPRRSCSAPSPSTRRARARGWAGADPRGDGPRRADRWPRVILVGDAPYYGASGSRLTGVEMPPPTNPDRVLGYGDWDGVTGRVTPWAH
jgi:predicted N-acetyltransferase YhbS